MPNVATRIRVTEVFVSVQGESSLAGWPTVFIRLTGCPLRCSYCDTAYAFHGGRTLLVDQLLSLVERHHVQHVCVTGGEPLAQKSCIRLLDELCENGYIVSLETSGAMDISHVNREVRRIVDIKAPGSGEVRRNLWSNLRNLRASDEIKFVLRDKGDYDWARQVLATKEFPEGCQIFFSPVFGVLAPADLAEWIIRDEVKVRLQLQIHKIIWGDVPGR